MNIFHKKSFRIGVAGVMAVVLICLGILVNPEDVTAKDTLQGIQQIVSKNTPEKPFNILEIVPDTATTTFADDGSSPVEGTTFDQSMGSIGYYIGGQEPVILERDLAKFKGSNNRKEYVDRLYDYDSYDSDTGVLAGITEKVAADGTPTDAKPLYFKEYKEYYASAYTDEEIAQKLLLGEWKQIQYGTDSVSESNVKHVDLMTDISMDLAPAKNISQPESVYTPGDFMLTYQAVAKPESVTEDTDPARKFFADETEGLGVDNKYIVNNASGEGCFDPGFNLETGMNPASYAATFAVIDQSAVPEENRLDRGYVPTQGAQITAGTEWTAEIDGKQIYKAQTNGDTVTYEYVGYIAKGDRIIDLIGDEKHYIKIMNEGTVTHATTSTSLLGASRSSVVSANETKAKEPTSVEAPTETPTETPTNETTVSDNKTVSNNATNTETLNVTLPQNNSIADGINGTVGEIQVTDTEPKAEDTEPKKEETEPETEDATKPQETEASNQTVSQISLPKATRALGANNSDGQYYILTFQYASPEDGNEIQYPYYYVQNYLKYSDTDAAPFAHGAKEYSLNAERPLVQNPIGKGKINYVEDKLDDSQELFVYEFNRGRGTYLLNLPPATTPTNRYVSNLPVYFEGGFYNNEWFKRNVFDREAGDQCKSLYITVNTIPAGEVTETDIANADMLYISSPDSALLPYTTEAVYTNYGSVVPGLGGTLCDLSVMNVLAILKQVSENKKPIVYDYQLMSSTEDTVKDSNVGKLMKLLTLEDLDLFYGAYVNTTETRMQEAINSEVKHGEFKSADKPYVDENKYCFDLMNFELSAPPSGDIHYPLLNDYMNAAFSDKVISDRFQEVVEDIENENLYRETDGGKAPLDTKVSEAATLRYIINFAKRRPQAEKAKIKVLEIQPCASYDLSVSNNLETDPKDTNKKIPRGILTYKKGTATQQEIANQLGTEIIVKQMTTAEFVGINTDLNSEYDMIYIGLNTGLMNTTSNGTTDYNDSNMDGLVYSNVGDIVFCQAAMAGLLDTDYSDNNRSNNLRDTATNTNWSNGKYRFSGNDINEETRKKLENFIKAGYPVLVENDMLKVDTNKKRTPNADLIDNSSYMYEFLLNTTEPGRGVFGKDMPNLIRRSNMTENLFGWYLNLPKPVITLSGKAADAQKDQVALQKADDGYYYLTYEFILTNAAAADTTTTFDCRLYVDINADGKFSKTKEKVKDIVITDADGNRQEADGDGRYSLTPGRSYIVKRAVSDEYTGIIPWELELVQKDNDTRRANKTGYYVIRKAESEPIQILQICSSGQTYKNNLNLEDAMEDSNSRFRLYINQVKDIFNITFTSIDSNEYARRFKADKNYLNDFDMLILGFGDCYQEADNADGAMTAIRDYIASGRSVLFTHDTTSFLNVDRNKFNRIPDRGTTYYWGYSFNTLIRDKVGLDRYGVLASGNIGDARRSGKGADTGNGMWNSLTDKAQNGNKETAYKPRSMRQEMVPETQGFTYGTLSFYSVNNNNVNTYRSPFKNMGINNGQYDNERVTQVNKGQITMYPYVIPENFTVSRTHNQYYQVDLEADDDKDGESDIVVWYAISDPGKENNNDDIYAKSPNDVRNNYYIYNKGNVTYSGVGHSGIDREACDWEVKLFVNTMIAAYRAGLHAPKVSVLESKEYTSRKINNIYLSYEKTLNDAVHQGVIEENQDVFFMADDVNLVEGDQALSVKYYFENPYSTDSIVIDGEEVKVTELTGVCPLSEAVSDVGADVNNITGSRVYKFSVPVSMIRALIVPTTATEADDEGVAASETREIDGTPTEVGVLRTNMKNSVKIYIEVTATLRKPNATTTQVMTTTEAVSLVRTQLFNLE